MTSFPIAVWKYPTFRLLSLEAWYHHCRCWDPMFHCHQGPAAPHTSVPSSPGPYFPALSWQGLPPLSSSPPFFFPASLLEPIFITHLTLAFPLLSPQLFCCRQASKKKKKKPQKTPSPISAVYPSSPHLPNHIAAVLQSSVGTFFLCGGRAAASLAGVSVLTL